MSEAPHTVYGRLLESVHIGGYSLERACTEFEYLLDDGRWQACGFSDISKFVASISLAEFKLIANQRLRIAAKLHALDVSQRAMAKLLGVDEKTIRNDRAEKSARRNDAATNSEAFPSASMATADKSALPYDPDPAGGQEAARRVQGDAAHAARKHERRAERIATLAELSNANAPLETDRRYPIVLADPPWQYEHVKTDADAIENHYPTMTLDDVCALPLADIVTGDAVLFLWVTSPKLAEGQRVIEAWGFTYRSGLVWVKESIGMGYWARALHEHLLIAVKGDPPVPPEKDRPPSVIRHDRLEHSVKPGVFYEWIERMYPELPRIELFARQERDGWARWGNQA